ncbi:MAG: SPOR domain-containing protein [Gammaproteobacteria bacterium]|nr:SPOR domain-containing protein [Gammaproteobacteria bacterium]
MRNGVLVLLLLNFLAYAYQHWVLVPDVKVAATYIAQDYPGLMLVNTAAEPEVEVVLPEVVISDGQAAYRCLKVGPFSRENDADSVRRSLEGREATVRQTTKEGQVWVGHWVQVADLGSRAKAETTRDVLIAAGMKDAYILQGDDNFHISLGVFRLRSSANKVMSQAIRQGYETIVADRFQPGSDFWLEVRLPGDRPMQLGEFRTDEGQILRTETISCAEAGI